ncbi:MAG: AAA family ATPase [Deltaproteobacteria bacterium]|nr:AAA family ATPase [Deltaproteobacteria bacterium]
MKVARIHIENFKRFRTLDIEVRNGLTEDIADQLLLLGDNGTGKTTVLQAVALCLSMAAGWTRSVEEFDWLGWVPGRYERWGEPKIDLEVHFTEDELNATQEAADRWSQNRENFVPPGSEKTVTLSLHGRRCFCKSRAQFFQFRGRLYASQLLKTDYSARELFDQLPGVFWFDQFRNLASPPVRMERDETEPVGRISYNVGVARLRRYLNSWQLSRMAGATGKLDFLKELENKYKIVFPGRSFSGPEPMYKGGVPTPEDYYFILSDGNRTYDIEEMSAGEQAVLPILYEFVRQQIKNSVVLIDEIDLNLHPPLAQALLTALPTIGPGCQFLLTTHSEAISSLVSPDEIFRLEGGRLCL